MGYGCTGLAVKHLASSGFLRGKYTQCSEIEVIRVENGRLKKIMRIQSFPLSLLVVESDIDVVVDLGFCRVVTHAGRGN